MMFKKNLALEASAGSGKTFALSIRYVSLLFLGADPKTILTLTFTNKASTEMSERIVSLLINLSQKEIELKEISKLTNITIKDLLKKQPIVLEKFLKSNINISTIDKFNATILKNFSLYYSIESDFVVGEAIDKVKFFQEFIKEIKREGYYDDLINFSVYEEKKVQDIFKYLIVLNQKRNEIDFIQPQKVDIKSIQKDLYKEFDLLKEFFLSCELLSNRGKSALEIENLDELLSKTWIKNDSLADYIYFKKCFAPKADDIFFRLKRKLLEYVQAKDNFYKLKYFEIFKIYKNVKKNLNLKTNQLEFDDITNYVYELIKNKIIDIDFLYFRLDSKIKHILIDEFQDTSITQFNILKPLISDIVENIKKDKFRSFFYVGDTKQSIYRFRGGVKELFYHVKELFDVEIDYLNTNYRSSSEVVNFVNEVFENKIKGYKHQLPFSKEKKGYIKVVEDDELLELIVKEVFFLLDSGVSEDNIAILTYANADTFVIEKELLKNRPSLNITTSTTIKIINVPVIRAIIEFIKYLYFKERLYLANFLALIGTDIYDIDKDIDISFFNINQPIDFLVKDIVNYFELYSIDTDDNILKFIEITGEFEDIDRFVFECEDIDVASPSKKDRGIKILTIHKSKGLEFSHVIIADRFKKKPPNTDTFIFYYDGIRLKDVFIRFKNRQNIDIKYQEVLEENKKLEIEDELNTLYVALTRAKNSLIICQKEKNSTIKLLGLSPLQRGEIIVEKQKTIKQEGEMFEYESISLNSGKKFLPMEDKNLDDINFGIALHYMLEHLSRFELDELERVFWAMKNHFQIKLEENQLISLKQRIKNLLLDKKFNNLINGKIYKEIPLSFKKELKQVDLLIEKDDHYIVVDYKSSDFVQKEHIKQVKYYKKTLSNILDKKVDGFLCYLRDGGVELVKVV